MGWLLPDPTTYEVCRNCGGTDFSSFEGQTMGIVFGLPVYHESSCYECVDCGSTYKRSELPTRREADKILARHSSPEPSVTLSIVSDVPAPTTMAQKYEAIVYCPGCSNSFELTCSECGAVDEFYKIANRIADCSCGCQTDSVQCKKCGVTVNGKDFLTGQPRGSKSKADASQSREYTETEMWLISAFFFVVGYAFSSVFGFIFGMAICPGVRWVINKKAVTPLDRKDMHGLAKLIAALWIIFSVWSNSNDQKPTQTTTTTSSSNIVEVK